MKVWIVNWDGVFDGAFSTRKKALEYAKLKAHQEFLGAMGTGNPAERNAAFSKMENLENYVSAEELDVNLAAMHATWI